MRVVKINDRLSVGAQPSPEDFAALAGDGFSAVVNARPDREEPGQPGDAIERQAAASAGLLYNFVPVTGLSIRQTDVDAFRAAIATAEGPVFAHCKSGTRALTLYTICEVLDGRMTEDDIAAFGSLHGFDLSGSAAWLKKKAAEHPQVASFYDPRTFAVAYVVSDPETGKCAIIDPVLDFDEKSGSTGTRNADALLKYVQAKGLTVEWILDTHPHADHFSAAHYLKEKTGAPTAIGAHVTDVQKLWKTIYNWPEFPTDGSQWDRLFAHGDRFKVGNLEAHVMFSPGHTLASITYVVGDAAFIHDTLFMPDAGSARCDFPGGSAQQLWTSINEILALPDETRLFTGHDYQPGGRHVRWESTVGEQKRLNFHVAGIDEAHFVALRESRDRILPMPKLILHALQVNIRGGRLPEPDSDGRSYLKFPLNALPGSVW